MDDFFSKYGWVIAVGVIITIVIAMMTPVGLEIKESILTFVETFATKLEAFGSAISVDHASLIH